MESPLFDGDPLSALDVRIAVLRDMRTAASRFSDAFWRADDALAWLRMVRDEMVRTGHVRDEIVALLELPATAILVRADGPGARGPTTSDPMAPFVAAAPPRVADAPPDGARRRPESPDLALDRAPAGPASDSAGPQPRDRRRSVAAA